MVHDWDFHTPRTVPNLMSYVFEKWEELRGDIHLTEQLIGSMNARLQAVVDKDGFWTKFQTLRHTSKIIPKNRPKIF